MIVDLIERVDGTAGAAFCVVSSIDIPIHLVIGASLAAFMLPVSILMGGYWIYNTLYYVIHKQWDYSDFSYAKQLTIVYLIITIGNMIGALLYARTMQ